MTTVSERGEGFISRLVLGTVQWGQRYGIANRSGIPTDAQLSMMCREAAAAGVHTLDTARAYGGSEARIGELLATDEVWQIITKLAPDVDTVPTPAAAAARARASIEQSLAALRRDKLYGLMLHRAEHRLIADGAIWAVLEEARNAGLATRIGVSATSPEEAIAALDDSRVQILQVAASVFDQRLQRAGFFAMARSRGVQVFVRSAYLQGAGFFDPDELPRHLTAIAPALRALREWAKDHRLGMDEVLLRYAATLGANVVIGCEQPEQLRAALRIAAAGEFPVDIATQLAALVPALPDSVLDPWRWP